MRGKAIFIVVLSFTLMLSACSSHYRQMPRTRLDAEEFETHGTARLIGPADGSASSYYLFGIPLNAPSRKAEITTFDGRAMTPGGTSFSINPLHVLVSPALLFFPSGNALIGGAYYDAMKSLEKADVLAYPKVYRVQSNYLIVSHTKVRVEGKGLRFVPGREESLSEQRVTGDTGGSSEERTVENSRSKNSDETSGSTSSEKNWNEYFEEGQVAFEESNYTEAENDFLKAIELNSDDGVLRAWLATTQYRLGKKKSARKSAMQALELNPKLKSAQQIMDLTE